MCLTSLEVRAWLLVEASSRPGARGGGGAEGGGAGDFHLERFSFSCMLPRCKHSSPALVGRPGQRGSLLLGWLPLPLLADLSLFSFSQCHSHSVILTVISKIHCKSPGTTFIILPGTPESQGPSSLQISGVPGPALGYPSGAAQNFVIFSGPRTGCTSLRSTLKILRNLSVDAPSPHKSLFQS